MTTPAVVHPPSHLSKKSRVRVRVRVSPLTSQIHHPWILLFFLSFLSATTSPSSAAKIDYSDHCSSTVPESVPIALPAGSPASIELSNGYFSGGNELLGPDPDPTFSFPRSFSFHSRSIRRTQTFGVLQVSGTLTFRVDRIRASHRNLTAGRSLLHRVRPHLPRTFTSWGKASFNLSGFWSESSGTLCMVGSGYGRSKGGTLLDLSAVFKLNYPNTSKISSSLVSGTVESLDAAGSSNHFDPISFFVYAQKDYEYTQISKAKDFCSYVNVVENSLGFKNISFCSNIREFLGVQFKLDYGRNCSSGYCGPFSRGLGFSPKLMFLNQIQCSEDGKLHMHMGFSNLSSFVFNSVLDPEMTLVGEGIWDGKRNRLCLVTCRVRRNGDPLLHASVDDCTIGFCLWFPAVLTIESSGTLVGRIWSSRNENDSGYFDMVSFRSFGRIKKTVPGLKYNYTKIDVVRKYCATDDPRKVWKKRYPDGKSFVDMSFNIVVRNYSQTKRSGGWGHAAPFSVGQTFYEYPYMQGLKGVVSEPVALETNHGLWNLSYKLSYSFSNAVLDMNEPIEISAEGIYNAGTGLLCMVGCQYRGSSVVTVKDGDSVDCGVLINIQLSPLNPEAGEHLTGTIRSTREKLDPFFFEPLEISSYGMYRTQAVESIRRIDVEIYMVLISLTLTCIFIGLQLYYVKKHPDVLPFISITMLLVLSLGQMIHFVVNFFEALFINRNMQNVLLQSGGWLDVNLIVVRVLTVIAFLLLFHLLQLTWLARSADEGKNRFWAAERRTIVLCLPLCFAEGLIAWLVHLRSSKTQLISPSLISAHHHSLWEEMISYVGLILDGFLLPQVILNIFLNSKNKALDPFFYVGITVIRALPHTYDAYRACHYVPHLKKSYIYASPDGDFYSSAWDIIIPCGGVLFAVLIYLQQRFGGTSFLPLKNKQVGGYETVPVISI